jgi:hypothetical protein
MNAKKRVLAMQHEPIDLQNLVRRLARLERQNLKLKHLWGATVLLVVALGLMGQSPPTNMPKIIEAERFTVRDANGMPRASWGIGPTGALVLGMNDKDGKTRITLGVEPDGSPSLDLRGKDGRRRLIMFVKGDDRPELILFDDREKRRVGLIIDSKASSAGLLLSDTAERKRASVFIGDDGVVGFTLLNTQGNPLILMGESKTGPLLSMSDSKGNARVGLGLLSVGPTLRLWDEKGGLVRSIP